MIAADKIEKLNKWLKANNDRRLWFFAVKEKGAEYLELRICEKGILNTIKYKVGDNEIGKVSCFPAYKAFSHFCQVESTVNDNMNKALTEFADTLN